MYVCMFVLACLGGPREKPIGLLNSPWIGEGAKPKQFSNIFSKLVRSRKIFKIGLGGWEVGREGMGSWVGGREGWWCRVGVIFSGQCRVLC